MVMINRSNDDVIKLFKDNLEFFSLRFKHPAAYSKLMHGKLIPVDADSNKKIKRLEQLLEAFEKAFYNDAYDLYKKSLMRSDATSPAMRDYDREIGAFNKVFIALQADYVAAILSFPQDKGAALKKILLNSKETMELFKKNYDEFYALTQWVVENIPQNALDTKKKTTKSVFDSPSMTQFNVNKNEIDTPSSPTNKLKKSDALEKAPYYELLKSHLEHNIVSAEEIKKITSTINNNPAFKKMLDLLFKMSDKVSGTFYQQFYQGAAFEIAQACNSNNVASVAKTIKTVCEAIPTDLFKMSGLDKNMEEYQNLLQEITNMVKPGLDRGAR